MIKFIIKGLFRDKSRSLLAILIVTLGVFLTVVISGYMKGVMSDLVNENARLQTGHVRIMTQAFKEDQSQMPLDLAMLDVDTLLNYLNTAYPNFSWSVRTNFGGLIDVPDENGNTLSQGTSVGMAVDLLSKNSAEIKRLNLHKALVTGKLPSKRGEALIGYELAKNINVKVGDKVTFITTTMDGSLVFQNFVISGTIKYGVKQMDNMAMIIDITDAQTMLDMENAATEILGFSKTGFYDNEECSVLQQKFNSKFEKPDDKYSPTMLKMQDDPVLGVYIGYMDSLTGILSFILIVVLSIVLWNAGLLGGLRRYNEFGIRLALGEEKQHIYKTLLMEAVFVGFVGSFIGTLLGVAFTFFLQYHGIDVSGMIQGGSVITPDVFRAKFTPDLLYLGFIPGLLAMVLGNMLSGLAIFRRQTANLLKEIEI